MEIKKEEPLYFQGLSHGLGMIQTIACVKLLIRILIIFFLNL